MNDREIDDIFRREAGAPVDPALLSRVTASMSSSLKPVRPIAPEWVLTSGAIAVAAVYAAVVAAGLGLHGVRKMSGMDIALMFPLLAILTVVAASKTAAEMIPGSRPRIGSWTLLALAIAGFLAVDAVLFHDYSLGRFVPEGVACLKAGVAVAIPAGLTSWFVLRRGFAVDTVSAGLSAGTLAGLAGVAMLELHCPNFSAPHIMLWHTAVIPVSGLLGMGLGFLFRRGPDKAAQSSR